MANNEERDYKKREILKNRFESEIGYCEHLSRYHFIQQFTKDKSVLDLGCGIGDGIELLSKSAVSIIGSEVDLERLMSAHTYFNDENINYIITDGRSLSLKDESFDVVISLEVIEHLEEQDTFVSEIKRVLKKGGTAILSTPNKEITRREGSTSNITHVRELTHKEFRLLLQKYFSQVEMYGQRRGTGIVGMAGVLHSFIRVVDVFKVRRLFSQALKDKVTRTVQDATGAKKAQDVQVDDFIISKKGAERSRGLIALCYKE